jgi:hypothetical protein
LKALCQPGGDAGIRTSVLVTGISEVGKKNKSPFSLVQVVFTANKVIVAVPTSVAAATWTSQAPRN